MKRLSILLIFSLFLLGADAIPSWRKIIIQNKEVVLESEIHGVSVGPHDEVAIDFKDGTIYLYDCKKNFISGYRCPSIDPLSYYVFFDKEQDLINRFVPKGGNLYSYNRAGELVSKRITEGKEKEYYSTPNILHSTDSNGIVYKKEKGDIIKIYPDGTSEIFFVGYKSSENDFLPVIFGLTVILIVAMSLYQRVASKLQHRSLKNNRM